MDRIPDDLKIYIARSYVQCSLRVEKLQFTAHKLFFFFGGDGSHENIVVIIHGQNIHTIRHLPFLWGGGGGTCYCMKDNSHTIV